MTEQLPDDLQRLLDALRARYPQLRIAVDPGEGQTGHWFVDLSAEGRHATVEWRPGQGFGISEQAPDGEAYGDGPDAVYADVERALGRLLKHFR